MRAINHALTGSIIGLTVSEPFIALPVAFLSHFVLDVIPHYGEANGDNPQILRSKSFKMSLYLDAILCLVLVLVLATKQPLNWVLAAVCAFVAASPDLISYRRYKAARANRKFTANAYEVFAHKIQWFERASGAVVEIAWLIAGVFLVVKLVAVV